MLLNQTYMEQYEDLGLLIANNMDPPGGLGDKTRESMLQLWAAMDDATRATLFPPSNLDRWSPEERDFSMMPESQVREILRKRRNRAAARQRELLNKRWHLPEP